MTQQKWGKVNNIVLMAKQSFDVSLSSRNIISVHYSGVPVT